MRQTCQDLAWHNDTQHFLISIGESLKKPTLFESMSDILELEEGSGGGGGTHSSLHQTHHPPPSGSAAVSTFQGSAGNSRGGGGRSQVEGGGENHTSDGGIATNDQQAVTATQYLHHNCNPRQNKSVNALSIETDV